MIDVHSHILPNVDDGARDIAETFKILNEACNAGFSDIFATSHYIDGEYEFSKRDRKFIIEALNQKIEEEGLNIKLHIGAEGYISSDFPKLIEADEVPTLCNSRYVLFELPLRAKVMYTSEVINRLLNMKLIPIIAHPERYEQVQDDSNIAIEWVEDGALLQCNYASIIGRYGSRAKETLHKLLEADAVHFLGTDNHRADSIYTRMSDIKREFRKKIGKDKFYELSELNPRCIMNNEEFDIKMPKKIKKGRRWKNGFTPFFFSWGRS